jgi:hypothetical protein
LTKPLITEEIWLGQGLNWGLPNDTPALYPLLHELVLNHHHFVSAESNSMNVGGSVVSRVSGQQSEGQVTILRVSISPESILDKFLSDKLSPNVI